MAIPPLVVCDANHYRAKGRDRQKFMTLRTAEFIRRFLLHVLPHGFHRIRHYGLFANGGRTDNLAQARDLLDMPPPQDLSEAATDSDQTPTLSYPCPSCGGPMILIDTFEPGARPRAPPTSTAAAS